MFENIAKSQFHEELHENEKKNTERIINKCQNVGKKDKGERFIYYTCSSLGRSNILTNDGVPSIDLSNANAV